MLTNEILKTIRRIEITTGRLVTEVFAGQYESVFKGRGMEFSEVREYQPGDDIRLIDWNVTARFGHPYVKKFEEERELTVMLLVDRRAITKSGSVLRGIKTLKTVNIVDGPSMPVTEFWKKYDAGEFK